MKLRETYISRKPPHSHWFSLVTTYAGMYLSSLYSWDHPAFSDRFVAVGEAVFQRGQWWRAFSSLFLHLDGQHLLANTPSFIICVYLVTGYFGSGIFFLIFLGVGAFAQTLSLLTYSPEVRLLGASGAIYGLAGFWLAMQFLIDRRFSLGQRLLRTSGVILVLLFPTTIVPNVSHQAHALGFVCGIAAGLGYFWRQRNWLRRFEVWQPEPIEEMASPESTNDIN